MPENDNDEPPRISPTQRPGPSRLSPLGTPASYYTATSSKNDVRLRAGRMLKEQIPRITLRPDGNYGREYGDMVLAEIAGKGAATAALTLYTAAGLSLPDLRCETTYGNAPDTTVPALLETLQKDSEGYKATQHSRAQFIESKTRDKTMTIVLTPDQHAALTAYYKNLTAASPKTL